MKIHDPTAGFVCYRKKFWKRINLDSDKFIGYAFQIEIEVQAT